MSRGISRIKNYIFHPWLTLAILLTGLTLGCSPDTASFTAVDSAATSVPVKASTRIVANGFVLPRHKATLGFPVSGTLAEVYVTRGAVVQAGQIIARLDGTQQAMAVAQAKAGLQVAEANLAALRAGAQPQEILAAEAAVTMAQANAKKTRARPETGRCQGCRG